MKFCNNCGQESSDEVVFCTNCGQTFQEGGVSDNTSEQHKHTNSRANQAQATAPRKPMSTKQKLLLSTIGSVIVLVIIAHLVLSNLYDPMKKIEAMNSAYNNQNKEAFFNQFHIKEDTVANPRDFYLMVNEYGWINLRDSLTSEIEKIKNKQHTDLIYNKGEFISVNKKPVFFGLYNDVEFSVIPIEVQIQAPLANMVFKFGDTEVISQEDDEQIVIGNYIPGTYEWSYEYKNGLMPLSGKGTYPIYYYHDNTAVIQVDWEFTNIVVESDLEDAIVFVSGKSTGKKVSELYTLYPAQVNPAVEIYAVAKDKDGNEVKSDILPLDSDYIYLPFEHFRKEQRIAELEQTIKDTYKTFRSDYASAIYYANFNYIEDYFQDGSKIKKDYAKFVTDHDQIPGYNYEFLLNDITAFKVLSDTDFELETYEVFDFTSDADGNLNYERKKKYTFSYIDNEIYINEILDLNTKKTKF